MDPNNVSTKHIIITLGVAAAVFIVGVGIYYYLSDKPSEQVSVSLSNSSASAGDPALSFQVSKTNIQVGDEFSVNVNVNTQTRNLTAVDLIINYPTAVLQAKSISAGTFLTNILSPGAISAGSIKIALGSDLSNPPTGSGTLATIVFKALAVSSSAQVQFSNETQVAVLGADGNTVESMNPISIVINEIPVAPPSISTFSASPVSINSGQSSTLSWSVTGATSLSIDQGVGTVTGSSVSVNPTQTKTYTLTATNSGGSTTKSATVTVAVVSPPTVTFTTTLDRVTKDYEGATLSWSVSGATTISISGIGTVSASDTKVIKLGATNSYTLTATNSGGSTTKVVTVTVFRPGDINKDGIVNTSDYTALLTDYSKTGARTTDINKDNIVNIFDYNLLVTNYNK